MVSLAFLFPPANIHICSRFFFYILFVPFIKVCHCCLCFPDMFSPQRPSAFSLSLSVSLYSHRVLLMLQVFPANMGAQLSAQLDRTHLLLFSLSLFFFFRLPRCASVTEYIKCFWVHLQCTFQLNCRRYDILMSPDFCFRNLQNLINK